MLPNFRVSLITVISVLTVQAQVKIERPSLAPGLDSVLVHISDPRPDPKTLEDETLWVVVARDAGNPAGTPLDLLRVAATQFYAATGQMRITFQCPLPAIPNFLDISLRQPTLTTITWKPKKPPSPSGIYPVDKKDKADVYLFGSFVAGVGAKPLYNLDAIVGYPVYDRGLWRWSLNGAAKTSERPNFDQDSFTVAGRVERIYPFSSDGVGPYVDFQWDVARWEFSRKDEAFNFVTAPTLIRSHAIWRKKNPKDLTIQAAIDLDLSAGIEAGRNIRNKVVSEGYGAIFRAVPGAVLYTVFPKALGLQEVRWTVDYRARVLTTREPVVDTRGEDRTALARGTRHNLTNELALQINKFIGFTVRHDYGSAPPAFKILDHRATVGVTLMWAWKQKQ